MVKKEEQKQNRRGWFISANPWVGCPVTFNLVIVHDDSVVATEKFRTFFGKSDLEIAVCVPIEILECENLIN